MVSIRENTRKIYRMLIKDPDRLAEGDATREQTVYREALKRANQTERNNQALSMAIDKSVATGKFLDFMSKADTFAEEYRDNERITQDRKGFYVNATDEEVEFARGNNEYFKSFDNRITPLTKTSPIVFLPYYTLR